MPDEKLNNVFVNVNVDYIVRKINKTIAYIRRVDKRQARRNVLDETDDLGRKDAIDSLHSSIALVRLWAKKNNIKIIMIKNHDWTDFFINGGFETMMKINGFTY